MNLHKFEIDYDGLSDFSIIVTNIVNTIANLIGSAIVKATSEALQGKVVPFINKIIHLIPEDIDIPYTQDLYLTGGFSNKLEVKEN